MPDEENIEDGSVNEEKKEPMSFLHEAEQEKVRKLVSQYQKIGEAEVGVQTDLAIQHKDVAIQKNEENLKCSCHDVLLDRVTKLENKIEQLVSVIEHSVYQPQGTKYRQTCLIVQTKLHVALTALMNSRL